jgi:hypothetical protein
MSFLESLKAFSNGEINSRQLKYDDDDDLIYDVRVNQKDLNKSIIVLRFTEDEYFSLFMDLDDDNNNNSYYIRVALNSRYYDNVFVDSYWAEEEWNEGYILSMINDENKKILTDILRYIAPSLIKDVSGREYKDISNVLESNFEYLTDDMTYEYASLYDETLVLGLRDFIKSNFCNPFKSEMVIESSCGESYYTSVRNLLFLYDNYGDNNDGIKDLLIKIIKQNNKTFEYDLGEDYYDYWSFENWPDERFQNYMKDKLEKMLEKIVDDISPEVLEKNSEINNFLYSKNIRYDEYRRLPAEKFFGDKNVTINYKVTSVSDGKIEVLVQSARYFKKFKITLEQFKNFLYHPTLFGDEY